jgi:hypothetical protein
MGILGRTHGSDACGAVSLHDDVHRSLRGRPGPVDHRGPADNPDRAGNFEADAEDLTATVLSAKELRTNYLREMGSTATREAIQSAFDQGTSLMSYIGHGGIHLWADENVLNSDDAPILAPQPEQPLLLTMNCLNGYFHFPYLDALSEALVKADGRGAIAAFSPSGLSLSDAAHRYHRVLLEEILGGKHSRLGDAVLAAQIRYAETGIFPEALTIYHHVGRSGAESAVDRCFAMPTGRLK